ncbi:LysR family transcriptional regulator [Nocardioides rotundus]|uniref:LysR substrate-binding domain-containing protein n=1 Tax=Nocardioides rotundus TaxID=1774216 RepID=UPI001CBBD12D|nr:LysR substrate-binding domain-containing protein [Nocardioides rotundus]UAL31562.1 LysR family transcriptional regulator [Nocardioides rotundus]
MSAQPFRVGFVTGATPDKWARVWRERYPRRPLELVPLAESEQESRLRDWSVDMALVRLPVDRDGLHLIPLYDEVQVVVAGREHFVAAGEEVELADLTDEQLVAPHRSGWEPQVEQLDWPAMSEKQAVETVAAGTGVVLLPQSVARLFAPKDVVSRPVPELEPTRVGLAWLVERDDDVTQDFVGVVRGRTANSSRR